MSDLRPLTKYFWCLYLILHYTGNPKSLTFNKHRSIIFSHTASVTDFNWQGQYFLYGEKTLVAS